MKKKTKVHEECGHNEENNNSVYMFHNIKNNIHLFINADDFEDAIVQFDLCNFSRRYEWRIFLETGQQPV